MNRTFLRFAMAVVPAITGVSAFADVIFTDATFNLANYSQTPVFMSTPGVTITGTQCPACGNPGNALQIVASLPNGQPNTLEEAALGFVNNLFSYNPSLQGPILSISASVSKNLSIDTQGTGFTNTFRPLIEQDGMFYLAAIPGPSLTTGPNGGSTGFNTISRSGLVASDFTQYNFTTGTFLSAHPNFSGDPILLGLGQISGFQGAPAATITAVYDNLSLDVVNAPEPGGLGLLGITFFAALGVIRRRRA